MTNATVRLWGRDIGAVSWLPDREIGVFQYEPDFASSGIQLAPVVMRLDRAPYEFPELSKRSFKGLPGLLADSLPDKYGNALINSWLASQSRSPESFNPVERLCYIGRRGMGALEFAPVIHREGLQSHKLQIERLVELVNTVLDSRQNIGGVLQGDDDREALEDVLRVGTSAGGARAKAVLAWNPSTGEFRSGQVEAGEGFEYWLMKFDGIDDNRDKELADPKGFGLIEYSFYLLAKDVGIQMSPCRIHREGGRSHFMTKRFDRDDRGSKLHMQSLAAMQHFDFNMAGAYSYEQAVQTIRYLDLPRSDVEQQFKRAVLNVLIRNQDDHVKNIAFLMERSGRWRLSPAFDVSYAYNPAGDWTSQHQMSLNNKRSDFSLEDLLEFGAFCDLKKAQAKSIVMNIKEHVSRWTGYADQAGVPEPMAHQIFMTMRHEIIC